MYEYRPLQPPIEEEKIKLTKCSWCEDHFAEGKILTLPWGHFCKSCCDKYVEANIKEGDDMYQVNKEMEQFKEQYLNTFNLKYRP